MLLQRINLLGFDAQWFPLARLVALGDTQVRTKVEQVVLDSGKDPVEFITVSEGASGEADSGIRLVHIPVGIHARIVFVCLGHVAEPCPSGITGAGIDFCQAYHVASLA